MLRIAVAGLARKHRHTHHAGRALGGNKGQPTSLGNPRRSRLVRATRRPAPTIGTIQNQTLRIHGGARPATSAARLGGAGRPPPQTCLVSFTDTNNIRHTVEVFASTLYEAATLAMTEFRRSGFTENAPGVATRVMLAIKQPSTTCEAQWARLRLGSTGGFEDV